MARILLIDATAVPKDSPFLSQPVGLISMAAVLRQHGHTVRVHDCKLDVGSLPGLLIQYDPQIVGIRSLSVFTNVLSWVAQVVQQTLPGVRIVVGGPHATLNPEDALRRCGPGSIAVLGEGEVTILQLVDALVGGAGLAELDSVAGLARYVDGELMRTAPRPMIKDLDSLPFPAYDLLPMEEYFTLHHGGTSATGRTMTALTSRGCPFGCSFCHNIFGRRFRAQSAGLVVDQLGYLTRKYNLEEVELHDDAFNTRRDRVLDICHGLQRLGSPVALAFPNGLRGDQLDREQLLELRLAGTHHMALSPETASPRLQQMLGKKMDLERLARAADICHELGIFTVGYFMLGFPTETEEEIKATIDWACAGAFHTASFFVVNPFPGTRLYELARQSGKLPVDMPTASYFTAGRNFSDVPDKRFRQLWHSAYRRFYLSPRRVKMLLNSVPNRGTLVRNSLFVGARLLGS